MHQNEIPFGALVPADPQSPGAERRAAGLMAGVYAVIAYTVGQRSNEIGLWMALGASTRSVLWLVLAQGLMLVGMGFALGLPAAVVVTRLLTTILFQVRPSVPEVYLAVAALLGAVAFLASYIPARRATKIDPLTAIRQE